MKHLLLMTGTASVVSGFILQLGFHVGRTARGHGQDPFLATTHHNTSLWGLTQPNWSTIHKVAIVLFLVLTTFHVIKHAMWYRKALSSKPVPQKRQTLVLSVVFVLVALTGLIPWWLDICGYSQEMRFILIELHDKLTLVLTAYLVLHILKRFWKHRK